MQPTSFAAEAKTSAGARDAPWARIASWAGVARWDRVAPAKSTGKPVLLPETAPRTDYWRIGILLGIASVASLWFFHSRNEILLSGDAVAHINIARRVFDSRTPGLLQLGSVWLPLPHLLAPVAPVTRP